MVPRVAVFGIVLHTGWEKQDRADCLSDFTAGPFSSRGYWGGCRLVALPSLGCGTYLCVEDLCCPLSPGA